MNLHVQFATMLAMMGCGLGIGTLFDAYRVLSCRLGVRRRLLAAFDLAFWLIATLLVFRVLYAANAGQLRVYVFLALGIGLCLYFLLFSRAVRSVVDGLIRAVRAIVRAIVRTTNLLVIRPIVGLYRLLLALFRILRKTAVFFGWVMLKCLYPFAWMARRAAAPLAPYVRPVRDGVVRRMSALARGFSAIFRWRKRD